MNTHAVIFVDSSIKDDTLLTFNGQFIPQIIAQKLQSLPAITSFHYCVPDSYVGKLKQAESVISYSATDTPHTWHNIFEKTGALHIIKIPADAAFMQPSIISEMLSTHIKYLSEFTFSYNLPSGYACEIISKTALENPLANPTTTDSLCDIIKNNLNQFDVELYYKEPDLRWHRVQFRAANIRDRHVMHNIITITKEAPQYESLQEIIDSHPEVLFTTPSYVEVELCGLCTLDCLFCYRNELSPQHGEMELSTLQILIEKMRSFNTPYAVCFGGSGEPLMHPHFYKALELCNNEELIHTIVVETNGISADTGYASALASFANNKVTTIININGHNSESYTMLHNADHFALVHANICKLKEILDAHNKSNNHLYLQILKINETESFLDSYYDFWEQYKIPIILQKQNTYIGRITDRRYADLTPLQRKPCWHLRQDLYILSDGTVAFCKQDIDGSAKRGNIITDDIVSIWAKQREHFVNDYRQNRAKKPNCSLCDEWYTYNL
ncbi:MAG: spiro-SPASM protein [Spirochaetes bacterium]|nr:spiro-SPASM protein [Spirochaetota bacterium]